MCVIYCSTAAGSSPGAGFSTCDSGGIRYWTSSVLMATLSGWSHLLKCSKVLGKSRRKGWLHQTSLINYLMIISVTQRLPSRPPPISSYNCFSLLMWGAQILLWQLCILAAPWHNLPPSGHLGDKQHQAAFKCRVSEGLMRTAKELMPQSHLFFLKTGEKRNRQGEETFK